MSRRDMDKSPLPDRPLRICFLIDCLRAAGTETQLLALINHLDRRVVQPYLCLLDGQDKMSRGMEPADCPVVRFGVRKLRSVKALAEARRFARLLRYERIDILQVYLIDSPTFGALVGRLAGVRHIIRVRNNLGHWLTPGLKWRFRFVNRLVTLTLTNTEAGRQAAMAQEGIPADSVVMLGNGIDLARFPDALATNIRRRPGTRRVGIVANLRPVKGLDVFLRAAVLVHVAHPDTVFAIAGEGELRPELERQAQALGLADRVEFLGLVRDIPAFLETLDIAVLSSRAEGMSNALLEYMAAGRPIVATAVGGNVELIRDGLNGLLVPPDNPEQLAKAIDRLLRDPVLATQMGRSAYHSVGEQFSWKSVARKYEMFWHDLASSREQAG
jgi:glycosyltransferase involved in cell wall biosynthesis